jgi:integration host factor subunit alpha
MSQTKSHIVDLIQNQLGLSRNQSVRAVESIIEIIKQTLENGEDVLITGFGKFFVKKK